MREDEALASLETLGLTRKEANAYLVLVRNGASTAADVSRLLSVQYPAVYRILHSLQGKGWIEASRDRPNRYRARNPRVVSEQARQSRIDALGDAAERAASLVDEHGYARNTVLQKITDPGAVNHSDDELAFLSYYPLLRYEEEPHRRALYRASLERSWQIERPERCPLWNVIYGALTGRPCELDAAVETLREIPSDLRHWTDLDAPRSGTGAADSLGVDANGESGFFRVLKLP